MKKNYLVVAIISLVLIASYLYNSPSTTSPLVIGVSTPLTGDASSLGEFVKNVSNMAIEKINSEGGIDGRMIELRFEDDACSPTKSVSAAQKLITADKVKIMILSTCSGAAIPVIPITDSREVFVFSGITTGQELSGISPLFARTVPSTASQGKALADYSKEKGYKNIAIVYETSAYPMSIMKAFTDELDADSTVIKEGFTSGTTDFKTTLTKIKSQEPDVLFLVPGTPGTAERLTQDFKNLNWNITLLGGDLFSENSDVVKKYGSTLRGIVTAEQQKGPETSEYIRFKQEYKQRFGKDLIYESHAQAQYDLYFILRDGLKKYGENPEKLSAFVRTIKDYPGFSGKITIDKNGDRVGGHQIKIIE